MLSVQKATIIKRAPESRVIISELNSRGNVCPSELLYGVKSKNLMQQVVTEMINKNVLRYNIDGNVTWHGKMQERELSMMRNVGEKDEEDENDHDGLKNGMKDDKDENDRDGLN